MKIETKFSIGDSVVFLQDDILYRREVGRIEITIKRDVMNGTSEPLITYYFVGMKSPGNQEVYKYENEVALTKEALIVGLMEN